MQRFPFHTSEGGSAPAPFRSVARRASEFCKVALEEGASGDGESSLGKGRAAAVAEGLVESLCAFGADSRTRAGEWRLRLAVVKQTPALAEALVRTSL